MNEDNDIMLNVNDTQHSAYQVKMDYAESQNLETATNSVDNADKHSANWTSAATSILLTLYADKVEMLETPKKKTALWVAISQSLKDYNIDMTPNQVRWKINALTQKYRQCLDTGQHESFKFFKEMESIYGECGLTDDESQDLSHKRKRSRKKIISSHTYKLYSKVYPETKSMIELRKIRLANRIESETSQSKLNLEKQWLEYLRKEEEYNLDKQELYERRLKLREEKIILRRRELDMLESLEFKKRQLISAEQEEFMRIEIEKCNLLRTVLNRKRSVNQNCTNIKI